MFAITKTTTQDLPEVSTLLKLVNLPVEGVKEHFQDFFVIRNEGLVVGCIGIEIYDKTGLLRSLAVRPSSQGKGLGLQLVNKIEQYSGEKKLDTIYLLTETAEKYFLKLGYKIIPREDVDSGVKQSIEFTTLCTSSSAMMKDLLFST
ncbi:MAG: arsenic resistance N-acetyltransferase ArsN2 [Candidatus Hodarchaeales archaeon]|jgi:amino-acid N-acetyltransferase